MRTSKPISTVTYNTKEFLLLKLQDLQNAHIIDAYAMIKHFGEDDNLKDHWNLYIVPAKMLQTAELREEFKEPDPNHTLPLCCEPFKSSSSWADWYLYHKHDPAYLAMKGLTRKYHYKAEDFIFSDETYFNDMIHQIDMLKILPYERMLEIIRAGGSFSQFVKTGAIPINLIKQFESAWCYLTSDKEINPREVI